MDDFRFSFEIEKAKSDGRFVAGWAYVAISKGARTTDYSGDRTTMVEITKAAHDFVLNARVAKAMHKGGQIGDIVESVVVDDDFAKAMGATTDKRGWWVKMEVYDQAVRKRVVSGELKQFSIAGRGVRKKVAA